MTIFRRYVEDLWPKVPTVLRRFSKNIINLAVGQMYAAQDVIAEALHRLSQLVTEFPDIQEMDINPFMVGPPGTTPIAVDARISVETRKRN